MATATQTQTFSYAPLSVPPSADPAAFKDFGRKVEGFNPDAIDEKGMAEIVDMLYKVSSDQILDITIQRLTGTAFGPLIPWSQAIAKAAVRAYPCMSHCEVGTC